MTKNFKLINSNTVESKIIAKRGYRAFVPRTWFNEDVEIRFKDGETKHDFVKSWCTGETFVNIHNIHMFDDTVTISLIKEKPQYKKMCLCGCGEYFTPKVNSIRGKESTKYIKEHYRKNILNKKDGYKFSRLVN